jgi:hypothetical protein
MFFNHPEKQVIHSAQEPVLAGHNCYVSKIEYGKSE